MFLQGMAGVHRRWYDGGGADLDHLTYQLAGPTLHWNNVMSVAAFFLGAFQIPFIINFCTALFIGRKSGDNPWDATTVEWDTPTPPPHGNFIKDISVHRGPYEYSVPGAEKDFTPQTEAPKSDKSHPAPAPAAAHAH